MLDYKELKFKAGLEIHQQISEKKLFCDCSTALNEKNEIVIIKRKLRTSAGEAGETDVAAEYEKAKDRTFIYHGYENEVCLVDTDSEPPHKINKDALKTALGVATILKLKIPDRLCVMRKIVIDGSCCSSFQKTLIVGLEGPNSYIDTPQGKVKITNLCLEEDACKIIKADKNKVHYSLSRQGIPLLEIRTDPDIKTPKQAMETAKKIGIILRSFPSMRRGIGTIRQDVNLSIKDSPRIELKGFQDLKSIPKVLENEIKRLQKEKPKKPEVRKVNPNFTTTFLRPMPGSARLYPETDVSTINPKSYLKNIKLPKLITDELKRLQNKYKLTQELAKELIKNKEFETFVKKYKKISPSLIAQILVEYPKDIKKRYKIDKKLTIEQFDFVLDFLNKNKISKNIIIEILTDLLENKKVNLNKYKSISKKELEKEIKKIIQKNKELTFKAIMGIIMSKYKEVAEGRLVANILKKHYKENK